MVRSSRISDLVRTADDVHFDDLVRQNRLRVDPVQTGLELSILGQGLDNTIIQNKWADECMKGKKKNQNLETFNEWVEIGAFST